MKLSPDAKLSIARKLRALREQHGFTQAELGRRIGRAFTTIASWESGKGQPDADTLLRLLVLYKVENVLEEFGYAEQGEPLSRAERAHIECLRRLPPDAQALVVELALGLERLEVARLTEVPLAARGNGQTEVGALPDADLLAELPDEGWEPGQS